MDGNKAKVGMRKNRAAAGARLTVAAPNSFTLCMDKKTKRKPA
jgi:hypothetical protein